MTTPIALLLFALLIGGIGLFVRAWIQGMRFGERLEARENADPGPPEEDAPGES